MYKIVARIAWASLTRRRARSILLVLMIAVSLWGLLLLEGVYDGMIEQMISNAVRSDSGHISLFAEGWRLEPDIAKLVKQEEGLDQLLSRDPRVQSHVQRLRQDGLVATAHYSRGAALFGVELAAENRHGGLGAYLYQGEFSFGAKGRRVIIGYKLADKLRLRIGGKLILSAQDSQGEVSSAPFRVNGILKTNNLALDENAVLLNLSRLRKLLTVPDGVTQVSMLLHDKATLHAVQADLRGRFPDLDVLCWDELYPALLQSRVMMEIFNMVTNALIFCVAALGIFGVMLVSVLERLREFGIMLAVGTRFRQIAAIILAESLFLGLLGFVLGALVGFANLLYFKLYGLDLSMFSNAFEEFGMDAVTYALIRPAYFLTALAAVTVATLCSVLIPLWVLHKAKPVESIHAV